MKYFIDTNIFLRTLIKEDETSFKNCYHFLEAIRYNKIKGITSSLVMAELAWTLSSYYQFKREDIAKALESVSNLRGLKVVDGYQISLALLYYQSKSVKFIDAMIASIKQISAKKWTIISYDQDFDKLDLIRLEPNQIIGLVN